MTPYETHAANATTPPPQDHHAPSAAPTPDVTRRAGDQWIRDALRENKEDVERVRKDIAAISSELKLHHSALNSFVECALNSIPNKDPKVHLTDHERWALNEAEKKKQQEENARLKLEVRNGIVKTIVNVVLAAAAGIALLGLQAQFGIWVNSVKAPAPAAQTTGATK